MASKQRSRKQGKGQKKSPMTASKAAGGGRAASSQRQSSRRDSAAKAREAWASALPAVRPKGGGALQRGRNVSTSKSRPAATREARGSPEPLSISPSRGSGAGRPREKPAAKPVNQRRGRSVARQTRQQARGMAPSGGLSGQSSSQDGSPVTDSRKKSTSREKSAAAKRKHRSRAPIRPRARVIADSPASNESVDADSVDSESSSFISQASGTSRQVVSKGKRKNKKPYNNYWRGYARAFENISMAHRASGSSGRLSFSGESSEGTSGTSEESARVDRTSGTRHKRHSNSKGHKRRRSICSSPSSGREISSVGPGSKRKSGHLPRRTLVTWRRVILRGVLGSLAPSTRRAYEGAARNFTSYAATLGCRGKWPMSERLLLCYLVFLWEKGTSPRTIRVHMAGLSFFSKIWGSWDPGSSFLAKKAIKGWRRVHPVGKDLRRPINKLLLGNLLLNLKGVCFDQYEVSLAGAAFTLAFFGAFRCGEIISPSRSSPTSGILTRDDVVIQQNNIVVWLKKSKTDQLGKGISVFIPSLTNHRVCPVHWLTEYLRVRPQGKGPLFIHKDGTYFSRFQFLAILRACLRKMGLDAGKYGTHSFRIGAATQAFQDGASATQIMSLGRWRSAAYKSYVRPDAVY
ncbi:uncharacterized protein LOC143819120 isoform X1 [Paroedura picta]|uniref:uncharacterized protein LOC143819120 isoform X1 n=1 Tax=Paroedura picta TaxID=143630 RepID=UPI0040562B2A